VVVYFFFFSLLVGCGGGARAPPPLDGAEYEGNCLAGVSREEGRFIYGDFDKVSTRKVNQKRVQETNDKGGSAERLAGCNIEVTLSRHRQSRLMRAAESASHGSTALILS